MSRLHLDIICLDNKARVRTVVFRGWTNKYDMQIYTYKEVKNITNLSLIIT